MRAFCEMCHVSWHRAAIVTITYGGSSVRLVIDPHQVIPVRLPG